GAEHARDGAIDVGLRDAAASDLRRELRIAVWVRELEIDTGIEGLPRGIYLVLGNMMPADQLLDAEVIGHNQTAKPPLTAKHVVEQPAVRVRWNPVYFVIARHD